MATQLAQLAQQTLTTGSSSQRITTSPTIAYSVLIRASSSNIGVAYIGNSGVTVANCSVALSPDQTFLIENIGYLNGHEVIDLSTIWWIGTTADKAYQIVNGANFAVGTNLKAVGYPGIFPAAYTTGYQDIGAVQRIEPAATATSDAGIPTIRI